MTRRLLLALSVALVAATTAVGPARLAGAAGFAPSAPAPGFLPQPRPVHVTAPTVRIASLSSILENQQIPLAGGGESPRDTVLLEFAGISLDQVSIVQTGSSFTLAISNSGSGDRAATIGGAGQTVQLWGVLRRLNVCLSSLPGSESCPDVAGATGPLALLIRAGGKLPAELRGKNLDIEIYALTVKAPDGATSLGLPAGRLAVTPQ